MIRKALLSVTALSLTPLAVAQTPPPDAPIRTHVVVPPDTSPSLDIPPSPQAQRAINLRQARTVAKAEREQARAAAHAVFDREVAKANAEFDLALRQDRIDAAKAALLARYAEIDAAYAKTIDIAVEDNAR
ncbi:MAG: hypothetical protein ACFB2Z_10165 [Maricaulaceae bacterium]